MFVETLENRRLFASAVAAAAQAGTVDELAITSPAAVAALAQPAGPTIAAAPPADVPADPPSNGVAAAARAGTVDETAQADGQAVAALARGT